jgi:hypothetical protein
LQSGIPTVPKMGGVYHVDEMLLHVRKENNEQTMNHSEENHTHKQPDEPIPCQYNRDNLSKTINRLRKALNHSHEFDKETMDKLLVLLSQAWLSSEATNGEAESKERSAYEKARTAEIAAIKTENDRWKTPLEDLEEPGARWRRDTKLISEIVQLENELGRELCLADVYQKFGPRIDAISDVLPFLVKREEMPT